MPVAEHVKPTKDICLMTPACQVKQESEIGRKVGATLIPQEIERSGPEAVVYNVDLARGFGTYSDKLSRALLELLVG